MLHHRIHCCVAAVLLAACQGPTRGPSAVQALAGPTPTLETLAWELLNCEAILTLLPATAADLQPHLPEGFRPLPLADAVAEMDVPVDAFDGNIGVETFVCASGTGLAGELMPMSYGSYYVMVEPPEAYRRDVDFHFIKWDVLVPDAPRREWLQAHGVPALDGDVTTTLFQQQGDFKVGDQTLSMGGSTHRLSANGVAAYAKTEGSISEFTMTPNGLVEWRADWVFTGVSNGAVVVDVGAGNLLADVVGTGPVVGASFIGSLSFVNGVIVLPPAAE